MSVSAFNRETREVNDLLTQLKGLVVVQRVLEARGVSRDELGRHIDEIDRVRARLADLVRSSGGGVESAAA